jgi:hypothetical protein
MADPLSLAVTITTLVTKAFAISNDIKTTINQIANAPSHIQAVASDLEDIYSILGTLKGYLDDSEMSVGVVQAAARTNIDCVLGNCLTIFSQISTLVNSCKARSRVGDITTWRKIRYSFNSTEIDALRTELGAHKLTLNMAISLVNLWVFSIQGGVELELTVASINLNAVNAATQRIESDIATHILELEAKLPLIISQKLEDARALALPAGQEMSTSALNSLPTHYNFTLQKYMKNIRRGFSLSSDRSTITAPSMQISSLGGSQGAQSRSIYISIYETARTHITPSRLASTIVPEEGDSGGDVEEATEIWVKTLTNHTYKIAYRADLSVDELKSWLHKQGAFSPSHQRLIGRGKQLCEDNDLAFYGIKAGDTVHMVPSIRAGPGPEGRTSSIYTIAGTSASGRSMSRFVRRPPQQSWGRH